MGAFLFPTRAERGLFFSVGEVADRFGGFFATIFLMALPLLHP